MKITLLNSITRGDPVLDENDEPVKIKTGFFGREQEIVEHEHTFCPANTVIDVADAEANSLIKAGHGRKFVEETDSHLPGAVDAEEEGDDLGADPDKIATQKRSSGGLQTGKGGKTKPNKDPALD